jgi:hypothetical protein
MGQAAVRALIAAVEGRLRALEGKPSEPPATFLGAHGIDPRTLRPIVAPPRRVVRIRTDGGMRFSEAAARYIEAKRKAGKMTAHTQRQRETVFRLFKSFTQSGSSLPICSRKSVAVSLSVDVKTSRACASISAGRRFHCALH